MPNGRNSMFGGEEPASEKKTSITSRRTCIKAAGAVLGGAALVDTASAESGELPNLLTIVGDQGNATYEVTVSGDLEPGTEGDATFDSGDAVDGSTASGQVEGGRDSYRFSGEITEFSFLDGPATLYLDGKEVAPSELPSGRSRGGSGGGSGPAVGGGEGYANTIPQSEASAVVSTERELVDALDSAASGDVVYVARGTTITASRSLTVPSGVTLASDRGIDGSPGGEIRTETELFPYVDAGDGSRITGVRIRGPNPEHQAYDSSLPVGAGVHVLGSSDVEIDNCEVSGFRYAGVRAGADTHVHHNHIHHCALGGLGYGVETNAGQPLIEYNYLNYTRHGVMSNGENGYTCRHNRFGPATMGHVIDVHSPGGTTVEIYNNTVEAAVYHEDATASWYPSGDPAVQVMLGGNPTDSVTIRDNWFYNDDSAGNAVVYNGSDSSKLRVENNHYGETDPASGDVGAPR